METLQYAGQLYEKALKLVVSHILQFPEGLQRKMEVLEGLSTREPGPMAINENPHLDFLMEIPHHKAT